MITRTNVAIAFAVALAILIVTQLTLPGALESRIERELARSLEGARLIRAEVEAFPAIMLLLGRVDRLNLDMRGVLLGDLIVDAVLVDGRNLVVDPLKLIRGHGVTMASATSLRATLVVGEDDLNQYLWSRLPDARSFRVSLDRGQALLEGAITLLGREFDVHVRGHFRVDGPARLAFIPEDVSVESARVPQFLLEWFSQEWEIAVDLGQLPFSLVIEELRVENGQLLIYGTRPPSG